ncbi:MAG: acyl-CoA thioesterase [Gammaproteobacteria bacterium]|nr:acyl-CoA thioesterase [Gammaproteobacteria bacterium]
MDTSTDTAAHRHTIEVMAEHLDNLGHVNNARYLEFFEAGRTRWYRAGGLLDLCGQAHPDACDTVVVNVNCDFLRECHQHEHLVVETRPGRLGGKSFAVEQTLLNGDGEVAARATVTSVLMDLQSRRAIALPRARGQLFPGAG